MVLDPRSLAILAQFPIPPARRFWLPFSPDGSRIACRESQGLNVRWDLRVFDTRTWREVGRLRDAASWSEPSWLAKGATVALCQKSDGRWDVTLFDARAGRVVGRSHTGTEDGKQVAFSSDGKWALLTGTARNAFLYDAAHLNGPPAAMFSDAPLAYFLGDGRVLAKSWDLRVFDVAPRLASPLRTTWSEATRIARDGTVWSSGDGETVEGDLRRPAAAPRREPSMDHYGEVSDAENTVWLRGVGGGKRLQVVDGAGTVHLDVPAGPDDGPMGKTGWKEFDRSPDGRYVALSARTKDFVVYRLGDPRPVRSFPMGDRPAVARFSPDGRFLFLGAKNGQLMMVRVADWSTVWSRRESWGSLPTDAVFSPDGRRLAMGRWDDRISVFDVAHGDPALRTLSVSHPIQAVAWSPDGSRIVGGGVGGGVSLWDAATGRAVSTLPTAGDEVVALRFLDGGRTLAACDKPGMTYLWRTEATP